MLSGSDLLVFHKIAVTEIERDCLSKGHFAGRRITLIDPDDDRIRNVYEDLDQDLGKERMALVTLFPENAKGSAQGDDMAGLNVISHAAAIKDILRMVKFGYRVAAIDRDILS